MTRLWRLCDRAGAAAATSRAGAGGNPLRLWRLCDRAGAASATGTPRLRVLALGVAAALAVGGCGGGLLQQDDAPVSGLLEPATQAEQQQEVPPPAGNASDPQAPTGPPSEAAARPPGAAEESEGIGWEDLESLALELYGDVVQLEDGRAAVSHGGASQSVFTLQNRVTQGDLDGDGDEDVVAHIIERSPGSGVFHLLVPVMDDDGVPVALRPQGVGDRIVLDTVKVRDGLITVVLFDRAPDEPFTVITRRTTLEIDLSSSAPLVRPVSVEPIEGLPLPGPERPEIEVYFEPGAVRAAESGVIDFRERQTYAVYAAAGQAFTASVTAPLGVWLDVRLGGGEHVLAAASERVRRVEAELPATGLWKVTLVSAHNGEADFELELEALPAEGGAAPEVIAPAVPVRPLTLPDGADGTAMYLTFDDGPHEVYTPQVLDVLARHGARATFFVLGSLAQAHPDLIRRIAAEGHTLANHTWRHEDLAGLPREAFDSTVGRTQTLLGSLGTPCLRPPYARVDAFTHDWAAAHGLAITTWNVDPADWRRPPAEELADHIVERAQPGAVVLLHDGGGDRTQTVLGLDLALQRLEGSGLRYEPLCR